MRGLAVFSRNHRNRYLLRRWWSKGPILVWIMLNPSTADENELDNTIRRCVFFSRKHGYGGLIILNYQPLISTDPKGLRNGISETAQRYNAKFHRWVAKRYPTAVVAWGNNCKETPDAMRQRLYAYGFKELLCLTITGKGHPGHPLYLAGDTPLRRF